jgi:hypothetical protein
MERPARDRQKGRPMTWILDRLFGPADFCIIVIDGFHFVEHSSRVVDGEDMVVDAELREGAARRKARKLNREAEDRPQAVI